MGGGNAETIATAPVLLRVLRTQGNVRGADVCGKG
jgi:hypothetical protein